MKLNSNYSSDISSLLDIKRNDSIFISTWNKDEEINPFPNAKIIEYNQLNSIKSVIIIFSDEFLDLKKYIKYLKMMNLKGIIFQFKILHLFQMEL